jgi:phenol 2-monooxygenase (NADPH)
MSRCGIKTRIVDRRDTKIFSGQADGLQSRTFEIFDSFGFAHRAWRESNHMLEMCLWNPDHEGLLQRSSIVADTIKGISRFQHATLHQGRIERFFLDSLREHSDIEVERSVMPTSIVLDESKAYDQDAYPIILKLKYLSDEEATPSQSGCPTPNGLFRSNLTPDDTDDLLRSQARTAGFETVKAKYVIGCDGAHSWVRRQLGFKLEGEQTDYIWCAYSS